MEDGIDSTGCYLMGFPITRFDGFDIGTFDETDKQETDTYETKQISRWYGSIDEYTNNRTEFVAERSVNWNTLHQGINQRLNAINTSEFFTKRPASLGETETPFSIRNWERTDVNSNLLGNVPVEIGGESTVISAINELSIITAVDRYAYSAPPEMKLSAAIEFAVWKIRQPIGSNQANAFVRSGAASFLDAYKYRSI